MESLVGRRAEGKSNMRHGAKFLILVLIVACAASAVLADQGRGGGRGGGGGPQTAYLIKPARVFDGEAMHDGWVVVVRGQRIQAAGPAASVTAPPNAEMIDLPGATLLPGLIEAHSHVLLHPYNETPWNDQVAHEPLGAAHRARDRVAQGHARGGLHDDSRSRHRRRGLRRRRAQAGRQSRHHSRPAHARRRRARSSRPARTRRRAFPPSGTCRRAARKPTASSA